MGKSLFEIGSHCFTKMRAPDGLREDTVGDLKNAELSISTRIDGFAKTDGFFPSTVSFFVSRFRHSKFSKSFHQCRYGAQLVGRGA